MRLIDLAFEAALDQAQLWHGRARARGHDQHGVRIGGHQLEGLRGDAGVGAGKALGRDHLDAGLVQQWGHFLEPLLPIRIGVAQEPDGLDALLFHVLDHGVADHGVGLRQAEHPLVLTSGYAHRRACELRRGGFRCDVGHGGSDSGDARADDHIHLVLGHEAARVGGALAWIGGVVQHDELNLLAGNRLREQLELVLHRDTEARARTGQGQTDADLDFGECGRTRHGGDGKGQQGVLEFHACLLRKFGENYGVGKFSCSV